jgi:hypothetical protein
MPMKANAWILRSAQNDELFFESHYLSIRLVRAIRSRSTESTPTLRCCRMFL